MFHKKIFISIINISAAILFTGTCFAQKASIKSDVKNREITFGNDKIKFKLNYNGKAAITYLEVNDHKVIEDSDGIYSEIRTSDATYTTQKLSLVPKLEVAAGTVVLSNIAYGDKNNIIRETWRFSISTKDVIFSVDRILPSALVVEEAALPAFHFKNINTWEGAFQDYGGLAWFYLFNERLSTYGVHATSSRFWNSKTGTGLNISVNAPHKEVAMKYTRTNDDRLSYNISLSDKEMLPRFDSGTNRKRFIRQRTDVWSPFKMAAGQTTQSITFSYFDFNEKYDRGKFVGLNGTQVSSVLNTIARIGVIDKKLFGGNSWHTPYGPICLHEQYIAQLGLGINDENYLKGYQECLDNYRDNAIKPDGRVWARWAYINVDIMPGHVTDKGFYEAQWGFLLDANPDFVTNVVELYDQTGDKNWVKTHQKSCEKALDWIINRDSDGDGLVEMMTDSHKEKRGSDWIDIIWAAYENAFVNAKLYWALIKWADVEHQLNNHSKAKYYEAFAAKLKTSFNKSTERGGFWDEQNKCYVHWLDKDGSVHGRNMVTPVNFMAIAYGICDNKERTKTILDDIETQMQKEKLFFWPLTMTSYAEGEGKEEQFPFPEYENGDIFLSWGSIAVRAYAEYKPELALKYVRNVMDRHSVDGLAFQRYGRLKQDGRGDDILSGNSLSVVGLYQAIYGINPMYNRFYLNPHITPELAGTELVYRFRNQKLKIGLNINEYSVANDLFKITDKNDFGFYSVENQLSYFNRNSTIASLTAKTTGEGMALNINDWGSVKSWHQVSNKKGPKSVAYTITGLTPNASYHISVNCKRVVKGKASATGAVSYIHNTSTTNDHITISKT